MINNKMDPMYKNIALLFIVSWASSTLFAQGRTQKFQLAVATEKIPNSLYSTIQLLDSRYDTNSVGFIERGIKSEDVKLIPTPSLNIQVTNVLNAFIDSSANKGELLLHLRRFNFSDVLGYLNENGCCFIRAELFSKYNGGFKLLARIDTLILVKNYDVVNQLLKKGALVIGNFIAANLLRESPYSFSYSFNDVLNYDSLEKRSLPVYHTQTFTDGLYKTFTSFLNQIPDNQVIATVKDKHISLVKMLKENGKYAYIKDCYAVVYEGVPYISTDYGYYPLYKSKGDFYYTGKTKVTPDAGFLLAASLVLGTFGSIVASDASAAVCEIKIDHLTGDFIPVKLIKKELF